MVLRLLALSLALAAPLSAFAAGQDLVLPGEKWITAFDKYVCAAFQPETSVRPEALEKFKVTFAKLSTDSTLDNVLLTASFEENNAACSYSAILFADNAAFRSKLVQSNAFSPNGGSDCAQGKAVIDASITANDYLYYGHPHRIAIMMPVSDAEAICGAGKTVVGAEFLLKGRKQ